MKSALKATLIASVLITSLFGYLLFNHNMSVVGNCFLKEIPSANCPEHASSEFGMIAMHFDFLKSFSTATFMNFILALFSFLLFFIGTSLFIRWFSKHPVVLKSASPPPQSNFRNSYTVSRWLSLCEHSPTLTF